MVKNELAVPALDKDSIIALVVATRTGEEKKEAMAP